MKDEFQSLLSEKDLINIVLDISFQGSDFHIGHFKQLLTPYKYFFTYRRSENDTPYALYTEYELRTIHCGFVHP